MEKQRRKKMSVQSYPWTVRIYKGEGRFLIVAEVEHRAGYNTQQLTRSKEKKLPSTSESYPVKRSSERMYSKISSQASGILSEDVQVLTRASYAKRKKRP